MKQQYQSRPVQPQRPVNAQRGYIPKQPDGLRSTERLMVIFFLNEYSLHKK